MSPGLDVENLHAAGRREVGPRRQHAAGGDGEVLGRQHAVERAHRDDGHQRVAQAAAAPCDRSPRRPARSRVAGRPAARARGTPWPTSAARCVRNNSTLSRLFLSDGACLLDRVGGVDGVDRSQQRHELPPGVPRDAEQQHAEQRDRGRRAEPAGDDPLVDAPPRPAETPAGRRPA